MKLLQIACSGEHKCEGGGGHFPYLGELLKGGLPLIVETTRRQFFQSKFGAKTIAASIT